MAHIASELQNNEYVFEFFPCIALITETPVKI